jgi:predicted HicB family RNase H-like nuclease
MTGTMTYKGYIGSVHYSDEDRVFNGQVEYIRSLISYEGTDVDALRRAFEEAVDDYLDLCKKAGKKPEQPFSGTFNVRTGSDLHRRAALLAKERGTTLNRVVSEALRRYLQYTLHHRSSGVIRRIEVNPLIASQSGGARNQGARERASLPSYSSTGISTCKLGTCSSAAKMAFPPMSCCTTGPWPRAAQFISSPYDLDAHYARKHTTQWVGYKVHLTETCEDDGPHLITPVETTSGPVADGAATPKIHAALQQRGLLPATHIVDTGFLDAALLADSRVHYGVDLLGPTRLDYHWQAREGAGFDAQHFQIDWDRQHAICPGGKTSTGWTPAVDNRGNPVIKVKFSTKDCRRCDQITHCIRSTKRYPRRTLSIRPQPQYQALHAARQREATEGFQTTYARRAGIEGTLSRGMRNRRLRRTRYIGLARVHLGHILTAVGLNVLRLGEWFLQTARAKTRITPFARLMADTAAA